MWSRIVGQDRAVSRLRRAADRPSHAYVLAGPAGSGVGEAARCFAAAMLCPDGGCGSCRACERTLRGRHPDLHEMEPEGQQYVVDQASEITESAFRTPVEGARKVIVLHEAERMSEAVANKLLKTFEEPPAHTVFVLLTSAPDELLDTVRSRCQTVSFGALSSEAVRDALVADGVPLTDAERASRLAGGRLDRARRLAGDHRDLYETFSGAPARLDGTGSTVALVAADLLDGVDAASDALKARHREEADALEAEISQAGYPEREAKRMRKAVEQRHDRVERRARQDALAEGLTVLESVYRDALVAPAEALNATLPPALSAEHALAALDAVAATRRKVQDGIVLNWALALEHLCLQLPAPGEAARL